MFRSTILYTRFSLFSFSFPTHHPRWFCKDWQRLNKGFSFTTAPAPTSASPGEPRAPLERRALWNPESSAPQGTLSMWLDILPAREAKKYPPKIITPPPAEDWEVNYGFYELLRMKPIGSLYSPSIFSSTYL